MAHAAVFCELNADACSCSRAPFQEEFSLCLPFGVSGPPQCIALTPRKTREPQEAAGAGKKTEGPEGSCLLPALLPTLFSLNPSPLYWASQFSKCSHLIAKCSLRGRFGSHFIGEGQGLKPGERKSLAQGCLAIWWQSLDQNKGL